MIDGCNKKNVVLFINSLRKGGAERVVSLLAKKLSEYKYLSIHIVQIESGIEYQLPKNMKTTILSDQKNPKLFFKLTNFFVVVWKFTRYVKSNNINTVASFLYQSNYINILSSMLFYKKRTVIGIRSTTSRYVNSGIFGKINLWLVRFLFNKCDLIISNSNGVDQDLKRLMRVKAKNMVWYNPIDIDYINKKIYDNKHCNFKFRSDKKYIISIGRLIPLKRNKDLISAFHNISINYLNLELIFVGDGECRSELEETSRNLGLINKVHYLGQINNPFYLLKKSDIFILNSETEGFPNVIIEAMACGLPVISSDCKSGPSEILNKEELYEVGDIDALSGIINNVLSLDEIKLKEIKDRNIKRANSFDINKTIESFVKIL